MVTRPQWQTALDRANWIRAERTRIRRDLAFADTYEDARLLLAELVMDPPEVLDRQGVHELLTWGHRCGEERAAVWCEAAEIPELKRLGECTLRQRSMLAAVLRVRSLDRRTKQAA